MKIGPFALQLTRKVQLFKILAGLRIEMLLIWSFIYLFFTPSNMKLKRQSVSDHVITPKGLNNKRLFYAYNFCYKLLK